MEEIFLRKKEMYRYWLRQKYHNDSHLHTTKLIVRYDEKGCGCFPSDKKILCGKTREGRTRNMLP
uniref:Chymotrypsin-2 n=1 Tax=Triatoma infestans TaxID=30076 RepID=A0A171AQW3_TRIIF